MRVHDIIERLRANVDVFDALTRGVSEEQSRWKPATDQWSILEVVNHLADEEVEDFRHRLDLTLHRPGEHWPPIAPEEWARERQYNSRELGQSVERLMTRRARSLRWLEGLTQPDWSRLYEHPSAGPLPAGGVLTSWLAHDFIHVRQLNRLHREYLASELADYAPDYAGPW